MSYVVKHLQEIDILKERIQSNPDDLRYYLKYDTFIGSRESIKYITKKLKKFKN